MVDQVLKEATPFTVELLYGDAEGGQRTITRFGMIPMRVDDGPLVSFNCPPLESGPARSSLAHRAPSRVRGTRSPLLALLAGAEPRSMVLQTRSNPESSSSIMPMPRSSSDTHPWMDAQMSCAVSVSGPSAITPATMAR